MMGITFRLDAITAGFTKGMATVNNSIKDVKKGLREFDVGNGLKQALGVGGIIAGFRMAITHAQDLRKSLEEAGKPVSDNIATVARYGDALKQIGNDARDLSVWSLSFFTKAGEGWGQLINKARGYSLEQQKINEETGKAADEQEKKLAEARKKMAERGKTIDKDLADSERKNSLDGMSTEEKRNALLAERTKLFEEIDGMVDGTAKKEKQLAANKLTGEIGSLGRTMQGDAERSQEQRDRAGRAEYEKARAEDAKLAEDIRDKFVPSVEQLAQMGTGGFAGGDDPRIIAKKILEKEGFAAAAGGRGDIKGAMRLGGEAQALRASLEGVTGKGTALTAETAESALKNALEQTNKELVEVKTALAGIIKAQ